MFKDAIKLSGYYLPYEDDEVRNALRRVVPVGGYGDTVEFGGGDRATFINAGHVPGSMMTYLEVDGRGGLVFTGDFNLSESNLLNGGADVTRLPRDLDYVVMEATYTSGNHPPKEELDKSFIEQSRPRWRRGGLRPHPQLHHRQGPGDPDDAGEEQRGGRADSGGWIGEDG